ncbi:MAG: MarR family transcriptional regulator [Aeromicrobium sp.]
MAQPSNPTRRVVEVLNFLARQPGTSYSLTELDRELTISKATLHAVVGELLDAGYLVRDTDQRRVRLGPRLIPIGRASLGRRAQVVEALRPAMRRLAADHGSHCLISAAIGDWIVVLSAAGNPARVRTTFREGQRGSPLEPPMGSLFVAWRDQSEIDQWLTQSRVDIDPSDLPTHLGILEDIRTRGFAVALRVDAKDQLENALTEFATNAGDAQEEPREAINTLLAQMSRTTYLITDPRPDVVHPVDWIGVPLLGRDRQVELALVMTNFPAAMSGRQIEDVAERLRVVAAAVSA